MPPKLRRRRPGHGRAVTRGTRRPPWLCDEWDGSRQCSFQPGPDLSTPRTFTHAPRSDRGGSAVVAQVLESDDSPAPFPAQPGVSAPTTATRSTRAAARGGARSRDAGGRGMRPGGACRAPEPATFDVGDAVGSRPMCGGHAVDVRKRLDGAKVTPLPSTRDMDWRSRHERRSRPEGHHEGRCEKTARSRQDEAAALAFLGRHLLAATTPAQGDVALVAAHWRPQARNRYTARTRGDGHERHHGKVERGREPGRRSGGRHGPSLVRGGRRHSDARSTLGGGDSPTPG